MQQLSLVVTNYTLKQLDKEAGAELGQAQPKLGLSLTLKFDAEVRS